MARDRLLASTMPDLKIDPELKDLIPPLTDGEYASLKESILKDGCREPLTIWKGHDIILDGHNRYQIARSFGLLLILSRSSYQTAPPQKSG
jgi:ParB-like chromosome segregation protein Spo0J